MIRVMVLGLVLTACWLAGSPGSLAQPGGIPSETAAERQMVNVLRGDVAHTLGRKCVRNPWQTYRWPDVRDIPAGNVRAVLRTWQARERWADSQPNRCRNVVYIIRQVFGARAPAALRVARCESHLSPRAVGAAGERGLFQIHPVHRSWLGERTWARMFNPLVNTRVAYRMSRGGTDWGAWTCKP